MKFTSYHTLLFWLAVSTATAAPQAATSTSSVTAQPTRTCSDVTGQACSSDSDCPLNDYCNLDGSCESFSTNGQTCEANDECWSLQCEATTGDTSVCVGREEGAPCWENSQCASDCCQPGPQSNGLAYCGTTSCIASCFA